MSTMISNQNPYVNLANAIVKSVARDYIRALKKLVINPNDFMALQLKEESENFFFSEWFQVLTNLHPYYLMNKIKKEVGYYD